ncbi:hypothetical protein PYCCODRAFT_904228 [Trametes coccinea BRFM310]|uniref:Secreted protein n=1 Tax=Trametes coccinea (strain BRFM310) TaxID=1353009 RepID=A0A1Y2ICP4_TRAC3|nr:hypothetical protein PYCCODRAFT_904228 [Trametes coccinea BRFM310]
MIPLLTLSCLLSFMFSDVEQLMRRSLTLHSACPSTRGGLLRQLMEPTFAHFPAMKSSHIKRRYADERRLLLIRPSMEVPVKLRCAGYRFERPVYGRIRPGYPCALF